MILDYIVKPNWNIYKAKDTISTRGASDASNCRVS